MSEETKPRCKQRVWDRTMRFPREHQCSRLATKDGYCGTHHPDAVARREAKSQERYEKQRAESPYVRLAMLTADRDRLQAERDLLREALVRALPEISVCATADILEQCRAALKDAK